MSDAMRAHRGTIFVEDAPVLSIKSYAAEQYVVRLHAPRCASHAKPGSFVHLKCDDAIPMRRPLSIMRADAADGWLELLFKIVGDGLRALSRKQPGDVLSSIGPIGVGFSPSPHRPRALLIGGGIGIPPIIFLAESLKDDVRTWQPVVLMGSELPFPFELVHSSIDCNWLDGNRDQTMSLLEEWRVPARLASLSDFRGTYRGYVTDLADRYLGALTGTELAGTEIFACGPTPMLEAASRLAVRYGLPCQVSLEEHMACAVGGCAGCTVLVETDEGPAMKRVCVDGPVFDARRVFATQTKPHG